MITSLLAVWGLFLTLVGIVLAFMPLLMLRTGRILIQWATAIQCAYIGFVDGWNGILPDTERITVVK